MDISVENVRLYPVLDLILIILNYIRAKRIMRIHRRYRVASHVTCKTINNEPEWRNRDNYTQGVSRRYKHLHAVYYEIP